MSSDILDVLNITKEPAKKKQKLAASQPSTKGIHRELYNLLGQNTPSIIVQSKTKFKDKLNAIGKPTPWTVAKFQANPQLVLQHWVKGSKDLVGDEIQPNNYEKFNHQVQLPKLERDTFDSLQDESDDKWEFEEVEYLFNLVQRYDLRWPVIHDRYKHDRSLEQLREKFYTVCQRILLQNEPNNPLIGHLNYNREKEQLRKEQLGRLLSRKAAEIAEEEALILEARKFEVAAKKTLQERAVMLNLLDSPNAEGSVSQYMSSQGLAQLYNNLMVDKSKKRKVDMPIPENPLLQQQQLEDKQRQRAKKLPAQKKKKDEKPVDSPIAQILASKFTPSEEKAFGLQVHAEKLSPGVYLRSTKLPTFKPTVQKMVEASLKELNVPLKPTMCTADVMQKHEELVRQIASLLDLKKQLDKLEAEQKITQ